MWTLPWFQGWTEGRQAAVNVHWGSLCFGKMNVYHTVVFENLLGIFKEVKWLALALWGGAGIQTHVSADSKACGPNYSENYFPVWAITCLLASMKWEGVKGVTVSKVAVNHGLLKKVFHIKSQDPHSHFRCFFQLSSPPIFPACSQFLIKPDSGLTLQVSVSQNVVLRTAEPHPGPH